MLTFISKKEKKNYMDDSYCMPFTYLSLNIVKRVKKAAVHKKKKAEGFTRKKFMHKQVTEKKLPQSEDFARPPHHFSNGPSIICIHSAVGHIV